MIHRDNHPMAYRMRGLVLAACFVSMFMSVGCIGGAAQLMYVLFGHKVDAEFPGFKDKRVAILTMADASSFGPDTLSETISRAVAIKLGNNIKKIDIVPQGEIADWMDVNGWGRPDHKELGKGVNADFVLVIELEDYGIHEGKTIYKGHSNIKIDVYDMNDDGRVVYSLGPDEFIFPRDGRPAIESSERKFEAFYLSRLADSVARHFHSFDSTEMAAMDSELMK